MSTESEDRFPQNEVLNSLRKERKRVQIFLINGIRLVGTIESFDQYLIMLSTPSGVQGIYKRAISTVQPDTARVHHRRATGRATKPRRPSSRDAAARAARRAPTKGRVGPDDGTRPG